MKSLCLAGIFLCFIAPLIAQQVASNTIKLSNVSLQTTSTSPDERPQIALVKKGSTDGESWFKVYGGRSYERAGDFARTPDDGYIILASTSSYGKGNYDLFIIKTDADGDPEWSKVMGDFYNEYGENIEVMANGNILIEATKQLCTGKKNDFSKCKDYPWEIELDPTGKLIKEQISDQAVRR